MPYMIPGMDLAQIFMSAQQAKLNQQRIAENQRVAQINRALPGARNSAYAGDPSLLRMIAPGEAMGMEEFAQGQAINAAKAQSQLAKDQSSRMKDAVEIERKKAEFGARAMGQALAAVKRNPQALPAVQNRINALAQRGILDQSDLQMFANLDPSNQEQMAQAEAGIQAAHQMFTDPKFSQDLIALANERGVDPLQAMNMPEVQQQMAQLNMAKLTGRKKGAATTINVNTGRMDATTGVTSQLQEKLESAEVMTKNLDALDQMYDPDFLTWTGKGKTWLSSIKDYAGISNPEDRQRIGKAREFFEGVKGIFNEQRRIITGAGASVGELKMLEAAVMNTNQSPASFEASLRRLRRVTERNKRIHQELLREGFQVGDKRYGKEFDRRAKSAKFGSRAAIAVTAPVDRSDAEGQLSAMVESGELTQAEADEIRRESGL